MPFLLSSSESLKFGANLIWEFLLKVSSHIPLFTLNGDEVLNLNLGDAGVDLTLVGLCPT